MGRAFPFVSACLAALLVLFAGGCQCIGEMQQWNVIVSLDKSLQDANGKALKLVEVHIIGVNSNEVQLWEHEDLNHYFLPGRSSLAAVSDKYLISFAPSDEPGAQTLSKNDTLWTRWKSKDAKELVIIADIPGLSAGGALPDDPRRLILPLDSCRWDHPYEPLLVKISSDGIHASPSPKLGGF